MKQTWNQKVPFDLDRKRQLHYPEHKVLWRDNFIFEGNLIFKEFSRGRSSVIAHFDATVFDADRGGPPFLREMFDCSMFISDLGEAMRFLSNGALRGRFTFCKKGNNYGVKFLGNFD